MNFPPPTEKQARVIWLAVTGFALATIVALIVALVWGLGQVLNVLSPVIWPIAVAVVLAYLLDPVVDFLERWRVPRTRAIVLVFAIALFLVLAVFSSAVPRLVVETGQLVDNVPTFIAKLQTRANEWMKNPPAPLRNILNRVGFHVQPQVVATNEVTMTNLPTTTTSTNSPPSAGDTQSGTVGTFVDPELVRKASAWVAPALKTVGGWIPQQLSRLVGLFGIIAGLALIPIYLFYLLLEKRAITDNWTVYLPVTDSRFKEELVFVLRSINDYLIAFFRGQVLVAICDGVLYGIGFAIIGLPYAFVIGAVAMVLTIIPFLGAIVTCAGALLIALVTYGDWQHPLLVLGVFALVQGIEGYVLQPKIIGDRVGLHPMVIIVAIMTGTTLLGGVLGGLLAIPLAAVLRVLMARYVWKRRDKEAGTPMLKLK
ncbi:MAG TPA: AI-2E family transporter [Verrucomicrobiae bacterium]|nr:AI-2E family transporter [Verrucomicrobiae bacterium]